LPDRQPAVATSENWRDKNTGERREDRGHRVVIFNEGLCDPGGSPKKG
jgi:hypothetical protein